MCNMALLVPDGSDVSYKAIWIERKPHHAEGVSVLPQEVTERLAMVRMGVAWRANSRTPSTGWTISSNVAFLRAAKALKRDNAGRNPPP